MVSTPSPFKRATRSVSSYRPLAASSPSSAHAFSSKDTWSSAPLPGPPASVYGEDAMQIPDVTKINYESFTRLDGRKFKFVEPPKLKASEQKKLLQKKKAAAGVKNDFDRKMMDEDEDAEQAEQADGDGDDDDNVFEIGMPVLVELEGGGNLNNNLPGVGVIVELWERLPKPETYRNGEPSGESDDDDEEQDGEEEEAPGKYFRVKWFQRIRELPLLMKNKFDRHDQNKIFYTHGAPEYSTALHLSVLMISCDIYSPEEFVKDYPGMGIDAKHSLSRNVFVETVLPERLLNYSGMRVERDYYCDEACDSQMGGIWKLPHGGWDGVREIGVMGKGWSVPKPSKELLKAAEAKRVAGLKPKSSKPPALPKRRSKTKPDDEPPAKRSKIAKEKEKAHDELPETDQHFIALSDSDSSDDELEDTYKMDVDGDEDEHSSSSEEEDKSEDEESGEEGSEDDGDESGAKRKRASAGGKGPSGAKAKTRSKKRTLKGFKPRPLQDEDELDVSLPKNPYERALKLLHVGATPKILPCREEQHADVLTKVEDVIEGGGGGCIYISGQPGTGKTATVHAVVRELRQKAEDGMLPPFEYVEINGLKIPDPSHAYVALYEAITDQGDDTERRKVSAKTALRALETHFSGKGGAGPRRTTYVVLMDELDQLFTAKQDVVYNFFNWPTLRGSKLVVIAVANTMDMPEKLAGRVKSRMGMERINFAPYTREELIEIVDSRLVPHPRAKNGTDHKVIQTDALKLAAAKTTSVTGDARRMLDVCRRAVEVALSPVMTVKNHNPAPVTTKQILEVIQEMSRNPTASFLKSLTLYQQVMMAAVVRCVRKEGIQEIEWFKVKQDHALILQALHDKTPREAQLSQSEYLLILSSLSSSYALHVSDDRGKAMEDRKIALGGMDELEVARVLSGLDRDKITSTRGWRNMFP